jgi:uncharacterized protein with GYD domain
MAKYLIQGSYSAEGAKGLLKEGGTSRRAAIGEMLKRSGGSMEAFYWTFGDNDFCIIADLPDHASAAAIGLQVAGSGAARTSMTVLLTAEDIDKAGGQSIDYRPPGSSS